MTVKVLFAAPDERWAQYETVLPAALRDAGVGAHLSRDLPPAEVDYIVYAPNGPVSDFTPFTRCKAVLCLWAGVETVVTNPTLTQPLTRMVDSGLEEGMVEYVTGHVLRHHLSMDIDIGNGSGEWRFHTPPLARDRSVGILGLGEMGRACAAALTALRFRVLGWSRTARTLKGVETFAGDDGLDRLLKQAEILVLLLPATPATENLLNARRLALLPPGTQILNPGRGTLIDDDALLAAIRSGHVAAATLDTFRTEPLPPGHPFWAEPRITITPHVASETRAATAAQVIAENIRRSEAAEPLRFLVDRAAGY